MICSVNFIKNFLHLPNCQMAINHKTVVHGQMKRSTKKKNSQTYPSKKESIWLHDWNRAVFRRAAVYLSFCDVYATSLFTNPNRTAGPSGSDWYTAVRRCLPHQNIVCFASAQKYSLLSCLSFLINIKKTPPDTKANTFWRTAFIMPSTWRR